jgi:hypothetical protein
MPIGLITHMDTTRPEDVTDFVTNVDYASTPFMSATGEAVATNTLHEWLVDSYDASAHNATIESSDATTVDLSQPTRTTNVVQLFRKVIVVSDTQVAIPHYGEDNPFSYQTKKKMTEMARDFEKAMIAGTRASGSSGVARQMDGAIALITSNKTARASGTCLSETEFNDILAGVYDGGTDETIDLVLTGTYLKRVIDKFSTNVTRNIEATSLKQVLRVDVYQSSFGIHEIRLSREVPSAAGSAGLLALDTSKWKKAYLVNRRPTMVPLAKTGSSTKAMVEAEFTLEALNQKSSAYRSGYHVG